MRSQSPFFLALDLFFAFVIWRNILRPNTYPDSILLRAKWAHCLVLFYSVKLSFYSYVSYFMWLILHPHEFVLCLNAGPNVIGSPIMGIMAFLRGLAGTVLVKICFDMMRRKKRALKWYMIVWSIHILCKTYMEYMWAQNSHLNGVQIIIPIAIMALPSIFCVLFYMSHSASSIFIEHSDNKE